jgi:hypothetical protein
MLLAINACKKESSHPPGIPQPTAYIYVGGSVLLPSGAWQGAYFKNSINNTVTSVNTRLDTIQHSNGVISMAVLDSTVYMAANTPGYWKGGAFIPVNGASAIQYLALNGNTIAMAGQDNSFELAYWVNGTETNLMNTFNRTVYPNQGFISYGFSGITLSGNETLISGSYNFMDEPIPGATTADTSTLPGLYETLWVNGNIQILYHDYWNVNVAYTSTLGVVSSGKRHLRSGSDDLRQRHQKQRRLLQERQLEQHQQRRLQTQLNLRVRIRCLHCRLYLYIPALFEFQGRLLEKRRSHTYRWDCYKSNHDIWHRPLHFSDRRQRQLRGLEEWRSHRSARLRIHA